MNTPLIPIYGCIKTVSVIKYGFETMEIVSYPYTKEGLENATSTFLHAAEGINAVPDSGTAESDTIRRAAVDACWASRGGWTVRMVTSNGDE